MNDRPSQLFILDTNVFIEAHRRYYPLDLCPGFWECIRHFCEIGRVMSIDRVRDEIVEGDPLSSWVKSAPASLFAPSTDQGIAARFSEMMTWVQDNPQYLDAAKAEFASVADGWLAAFSSVNDGVLVTRESLRPRQRNRVPLPNVCNQFGVAYCDTFSMLRQLNVRFGWLGP